MRLSGDRRSTVCAGQCRGSNSSEPGLLAAREHCDKRVTVGICVLFLNSTLFVLLSIVFSLSPSFTS